MNNTITNYIKERIRELEPELYYLDEVRRAELQAVLSKIEELGK